MTTDLVDAVNALIRPSRSKVIQGDKVTTVTHDPLLVQLEAAVTASFGGSASGGGSATGSVINDAALYQLLLIKTQVGDWCRLAGVTPDRQSATVSLERWSLAFMGDGAWQTRTLHEWAQTITDLLDPPKTVPLAGPCPVCKAVNWVAPDGNLRASPVAVLYDQATLHASLRATCRVETCGAEWTGADAVQELIEELTESEINEGDKP